MKGLVLIMLFLTVSCSNDDGPEPGCYQESDRRIVDEVNNATGTVLGSRCSGKAFLLEPDHEEQSGPLGEFYPCNLAETFQVDSARVVFSGYVYESFDNENICADLFEITEIRLIDQSEGIIINEPKQLIKTPNIGQEEALLKPRNFEYRYLVSKTTN